MLNLEKIKRFFIKNSYSFALAGIIIFTILLTASCVSATYDKGAIVNSTGSNKVKMIAPTIVEKEVVVKVEIEPTYFDDFDISASTKSQLKDRVIKINELIKSAEALNMNDTSLVTQAYAELERINQALETGSYLYPYSDNDLNLMAYMLFDEAGDASNEEQQLVGCVILNRQKMGGINQNMVNPTLTQVINEQGQYYRAIKMGYNLNISTISLDKITERCYNNARIVLEHRYECPDNVVYQATFKQGSGVYKSFYHDAPYYNTTYFCYL